jgi:ribulose-bisphosphate carboxylase large chain
VSEWLRATYRVDAPRAEIDAIAAAIAVEQSVEMPLAAIDDRFVLDHVVGRVVAIEPVGPDTADVVVELSAETVGDNVAQLVNMVFGNTSLQPFVELVDLTLPAGLGSLLPGPNGGIAKLRLLTGARGRALTCTAVKPQGLRPDALAARCAVFAAAGIDVIKDDHGMADQARAPFRDRVAACQAAVAAANAETGHAAVYAPSLVGGPRQLFDQAAWAEDQGVGAVLVAPMLVGLAVFADLVAAHPDLVFLGHPSFGGAARVAPPLLIGTIFRGLGADAVIFPNFGGRFSYTPDECAAIATRARSAEPSRPALPVPAGGMTVDRVPELIGFYGHDAMLLIGGGLLTAADPGGAAREFVDTVAAHAAPLQGVAP